MRYGSTCQCFKKWLVLSTGALGILASVFPVTPACGILQSLVVFSIFHVFGGYHARSTASVNKIVEVYRACGTVFAFPSCRNWAPKICNLTIFWHVDVSRFGESNRLYFNAVKDLGAAFLCMPEQKVI